MSAFLVKNSLPSALLRCSSPVIVNKNSFIHDYQKQLSAFEHIIKPRNQVQVYKESNNVIEVKEDAVIAPVTGIPEQEIQERLVRIYQRPKNAMQSGTDNVDHWEIEFDTKERWENPLMGWSSTGDPVSNMKVQFFSKEEAVKFVEKNGYQYYIEGEKKVAPRVKSYGFNFSWNKRSRVSTK